MKLPDRHSITWRLFSLAARAIGFAMLVAAFAFVWQDFQKTRKSKVDQALAVAQLLASNSTVAVSFDQREAATELLSSLRHQPEVVDAYILDGEGHQLAVYVADGQRLLPATLDADDLPGSVFTDSGQLEIRYPIWEDGEQIGSLLIHSSTDDLAASMWRNLRTSFVVMFLSLLVGLALALHLQRSITRPILRLTHTAQEISETGDYTLRVDVEGDGEVGILCRQFNRMIETVDEANRGLNAAHEAVVMANDLLEERVNARTSELAAANDRLLREIDERKKAHAELQELQSQLVQTSRQAGMAELANGVLHNIGNVLNSVNVSASILAEKVADIKSGSLTKAVELLEANRSQLGTFLQHDEKGVHLLPFLAKFANHLRASQESAVESVASLKTNIQHIESIVQSQQSFAGSYGVIETCTAISLFEDALKFVGRSIDRHHIELIRDFQSDAVLELDKGKLLQVLVNFIRNAKDALVESGQKRKTIILRLIQEYPHQVEFQVCDNGVGIAASNLTNIFSHGFTTKKHGHGFGLHSAAIAAKEIGGTVAVNSDGLGAGATFSVTVATSPGAVNTVGSKDSSAEVGAAQFD